MYYKSNTAALGLGEYSPVLGGCHTSAEGSCPMPAAKRNQHSDITR